jgi:hypothetical protein
MLFDHASIPADRGQTFFDLDTRCRSRRGEAAAGTFLEFLTLDEPRSDYLGFQPNIFSGSRR